MASAAEQFQVDTSKAAAEPEYMFGDWITGRWSDKNANAAQIKANADYEQANLTAARAWEEYLDSTKYQRSVEDLKKAGLNPWLAVQNGITGGSSMSGVNAGNNSGKSVESANPAKGAAKVASSLVGTALKILFLIMLGG